MEIRSGEGEERRGEKKRGEERRGEEKGREERRGEERRREEKRGEEKRGEEGGKERKRGREERRGEEEGGRGRDVCCELGHTPVHSRKVSPEVPSPAGCRDVLCIHHHWVTLRKRGVKDGNSFGVKQKTALGQTD